MFRPYEPAAIIGDFSSQQPFLITARAILEGSRHFIEIRNGDTPTGPDTQ